MKPLVFSVFLLVSCSAAPAAPEPQWLEAVAPPAHADDRPLQIEANWKERIAQPYVFVEHVGDYRRLGDAMRQLITLAEQAGIERTGVPFALFFDDPGRVPVERLRARACLPVGEAPADLGGLRFEVLARAMVVYARVPGAYTETARSYPALFSYLTELGWEAGGPIRELYLVNPADVASYDQLETEVQIPWGAPGR